MHACSPLCLLLLNCRQMHQQVEEMGLSNANAPFNFVPNLVFISVVPSGCSSMSSCWAVGQCCW